MNFLNQTEFPKKHLTPYIEQKNTDMVTLRERGEKLKDIKKTQKELG